MPVITVVGPSHAGKSTLVRLVTRQPGRFGLPASIASVNLDEELGSSDRSNSTKAIEVVQKYGRGSNFTVVDCGAGQTAFAPDFRAFVARQPEVLIVVWCDEVTFRQRHSEDRADAEIGNNYSEDLIKIWDLGRAHGRFIDISSGISKEQSASRMADAIRGIIQQGGA